MEIALIDKIVTNSAAFRSSSHHRMSKEGSGRLYWRCVQVNVKAWI